MSAAHAVENEPPRLLRRGEVERMVGLRRSTIYARMAAGAFPRPIRLRGKIAASAGAVAWLEADIVQWIDECAAATRGRECAA